MMKNILSTHSLLLWGAALLVGTTVPVAGASRADGAAARMVGTAVWSGGPGPVANPRAEGKTRRKGAHLRLEEATCDFGDVPRKGGDLVREFRFTNDGTEPLVLLRAIISCSCLKADLPKRPVAPGASGVVRITYQPHKSEPGAFNKVIYIYSNSVDERDVITVQGNSIDGRSDSADRRPQHRMKKTKRL